MGKKIYLDNCCFNRPYDTQNQEVIKLETKAKLYIQELVRQESLNLVWSFILDFENNANPFIEQKESIGEWKKIATTYVSALEEIRMKANQIQEGTGLKSKDSLHVACAIFAKSEYLITTDKKMLKTELEGIKIINPVQFVFKISEEK